MSTILKIFAFTIASCLFYSYVGQMVPQKETHPPETRQLGADLTTAELAQAGAEIVAGKGTCLTCHTIGQEGGALRFPDLGRIGAVAATRREGLSDVDYLAESIYEPGAFIVEGFQAGMPAIHRPPIGLSDAEIVAVIAYLQSLGGTPTVTMQTPIKYAGAAEPAAPPVSAAASTPDGEPTDAEALLDQYMCKTCHAVDAPTRLVGPSLFDVGTRLTRAELYEALVDPDATVAEGFPSGLMGATLQASGFQDRITPKQLKALVDYLSERKG